METRWKRADYKTKLSVLGYTRRIMNDMKGSTVPLCTQYYCLSYFFVRDYFTKHGDNITVNEDGNIAQGRTNRFTRTTVCGNEVIDVNKTNHKKRWKWTFRITQSDPDAPGFAIGINDSDKTILGNSVYGIMDGVNSYMLTNKGRVYHKGERYLTSSGYDAKPSVLNQNPYNIRMISNFFSHMLSSKAGVVSSGARGIPNRKKEWGKHSIIEMEIVHKKDLRERDCWFQPIPESEIRSKWHLIFTDCETGGYSTAFIDPGKYNLAVVIAEKGQCIELLKYEFE